MGYNLVNPLITIWGLFSHPIYLNIVLLGCLLIGFIYHIDPLTILRSLRFWCLNTTGYIWRHVVWSIGPNVYVPWSKFEQLSPIGWWSSIHRGFPLWDDQTTLPRSSRLSSPGHTHGELEDVGAPQRKLAGKSTVSDSFWMFDPESVPCTASIFKHKNTKNH